jgi:hypothetical protein
VDDFDDALGDQRGEIAVLGEHDGAQPLTIA